MAAVTVRPCSAAEARAWLLRALRHDTTAGACSQADHEADCAFGLVVDATGTPCGAYSLRQSGQTLWVMQAGGDLGGVDLVREVLPGIEQGARAAGLDQIAITTRRRGLVRKMQRAGYQITGITLRKRV